MAFLWIFKNYFLGISELISNLLLPSPSNPWISSMKWSEVGTLTRVLLLTALNCTIHPRCTNRCPFLLYFLLSFPTVFHELLRSNLEAVIKLSSKWDGEWHLDVPPPWNRKLPCLFSRKILLKNWNISFSFFSKHLLKGIKTPYTLTAPAMGEHTLGDRNSGEDRKI